MTGALTLPDSMRIEVYGPYVGLVRSADVTVGRRRREERDWRAIVIFAVDVIVGCREIDSGLKNQLMKFDGYQLTSYIEVTKIDVVVSSAMERLEWKIMTTLYQPKYRRHDDG